MQAPPLFGNQTFIVLCIAGLIVNGIGLFSNIMLTDGLLYAVIAKNMVVNDEYLWLTLNGADWLDKPHFPFWCAALSYRIFGITAFAYKLPAFCFWLAGLAYTYVFAKALYGKRIAQIAMLIYMSVLHLLISNTDVRAEPYLTGMIIASAYHFYKVSTTKLIRHVIFGALWAALAVMTKGIFVLIVIGGGFIIYWIVIKEWRQFLDYRWYLSMLLILVFISPELYSLYTQFDARPEIEVFGRKNVSGIKFFFWDSQFGRFTNSGPIKGSGDPFFYFHTFLWAFLPWSFLFLTSMVRLFMSKNSVKVSSLLWGCVAITFLMFSLSSFQLPHYLNIIFSVLAIWTAHLISLQPLPGKIRLYHRMQWWICLLLATVISLLTYFYHADNWIVISLSITVSSVILLWRYYPAHPNNMVLLTYSTGLCIGIFYSIYLYPALLKYQSGDQMAEYLQIHHPKTGQVNVMKGEINNLSLDFYSSLHINIVSQEDNFRGLEINSPLVVPENRLHELDTAFEWTPVKAFDDYHVSRITPRFYFHGTREKQLGKLYLVHIKPKSK